ncbi:unnamed protein product [Effrenium voratum]|nr:unnamed protein product [Effrenium voratum]CAJ1437899.1 unnamed protein product [Effrenium voratum]|mmetsp:Transcript_104485/g.248629  ORF Transcript_104485/g.248629 Transcript_104485/m.248629 type:complete len:134 (+) Transcript_104485:62-463(+)
MWLATGFLAASLGINIAVLVPVLVGLLKDTDRIKTVYGAETPARGILKAMYSSILLVSLALLPAIFVDASRVGAQFMAAALLVVQIVYKFLTPATTTGGVPPSMPMNPVVISNLGIALFHTVSVAIFLSHLPG